MFNPVKDIKEFHEKFGLRYDGLPRELSAPVTMFRASFMQEELNEYINSTALVDKLDALVDLMYVVLGTAYMHGFKDFEEAWRRVHAANMSKVRATTVDQSKRSSKLDVIKPEGWNPPVLLDLV
jgi:predicted HAD superfamily Cof-like phosphohydrolase